MPMFLGSLLRLNPDYASSTLYSDLPFASQMLIARVSHEMQSIQIKEMLVMN